MPLSADQLRQLLTERSDPARDRPAPQERLLARIRRARFRRAAGASLMAVVAVAGLVSVVNLAHEHAPGVRYSGPAFPASFTASDGASYHQLAVTSLAEPAQKSATINVRVGSYPIDVMAACDAPKSGAFMVVKVNGIVANLLVCQEPPQLIGLSVRQGRQANITFIQGSIPGLPNVSTNWRLAAYEWKPPAIARPAPPVPRLPLSYTSYNTTTGHGQALRRLIASRSGDWPGNRTATITVPYHGRSIDVSMVCSGAIGGRLQVTFQVDGSLGQKVSCRSWSPGQEPQASTSIGGRVGIPMTLTFRIQAPDPYAAVDYAKRAASWTIGIYEEEF